MKDIIKIIDFVKELLRIFLLQFREISRKKLERYSPNHHFIEKCLCRDFLKFAKKNIFPKSSISSKISCQCFCICQHVVKDIIKIVDFVKVLLRIVLSKFRKISKNIIDICPKIIQEWFKSSLNGFNHFGVGVDSSLTSGDMLEYEVAVVCVVFIRKHLLRVGKVAALKIYRYRYRGKSLFTYLLLHRVENFFTVHLWHKDNLV